MKKFISIFFLFSFLLTNAQLIGTVNSQHKQRNNGNAVITPPPPPDPEFTRFIIVGASIMYNTFYFTDQMKDAVEAAYPSANVTFYNHASPGETIGSYATGSIPNITNTLSLYDNSDPTIQTFVIVHLGGNDRTNRGPWDTLDPSEITSMNDNLDLILDAIEAKGFTPILNDLSFRDYDDISYDDENHGVLPYNDNLIKPKILARSAEFAFADGQSFWQLYPLIYNDYETYLSADNIHPTGTGYAAMKTAFVNTICKYIFTGEAPTKLIQENQNTLQEKSYFDAFLVEASEAANLQTLINTHNHVRLGKGDFSASGNITISSNQSIYGFPAKYTTLGGTLSIAAGSTNAHVEWIDTTGDLTFASGGVTSNVTLKHIAFSNIYGTGVQLENCQFIDINTSAMRFDNSANGYLRNCITIKAWAQAINDHVILKGNDITPSYGNIELSRNLLTSSINTTFYDNLASHTFLGVDAESWDTSGTGTAAFTMTNIGKAKMFNLNGNSTPATMGGYDIQADEAILQRGFLNASEPSVIRSGTNLLYLNKSGDSLTIETDVFDFIAHSNDTATALNGVDVSAEITGTDATTLTNMILGTEHTPIPKPTFEELPNPTGDDWATDRIGQTDVVATIQAMIDSNDIAELDEGIYYIGSSIHLTNGQGVLGKGTGKTAIVGLTDDFPLFVVDDNPEFAQQTNRYYPMGFITLQGGSNGFYIKPASENFLYMLTNNPLNNVIFRNQSVAILMDTFYGYDNNFLDNVHFIDCGIGLQQIKNPSPVGGTDPTMMYMDKTVFYNSQVINCGVGFDMPLGRANNLNAWINCNFDGNGKVFNAFSSNGLYVANSVIKNTTGANVITGSAAFSLYGVDFEGNDSTDLFANTRIYAEGCNFNDAGADFFSAASGNWAYLWDNTINSTLNASQISQGVLMNNTITGNAALSKIMVEIVSGTPLTVLDGVSTPYPQLLVTH